MKVMYVDNSQWWGGAEACLNSYLLHQAAHGISQRICVRYPLPHFDNYDKTIPGCVVHRFPKPKWWMPESAKTSIRGHDRIAQHLRAAALSKQIEQFKPDIAYFNLYRRRDCWDIAAAKKQGCKVVAHIRSLFHQAPFSKADLDKCDLIIAMSDIVATQARSSGTKTPIHRIYDGVDTSEVRSSDRDATRLKLGIKQSQVAFVFPAVLESRKGQDIAIEAWQQIARRQPNAVLVIVGGACPTEAPDYVQHCQNMASKLGDAVIFVGHQNSMPSVYAAADAVLALSRDGEAYGRIPVEAGISGKPVIATRAGATPELIVNGETGFLVEPQSADDVAARVLELMSKQERTRLGGNARKHVAENFDKTSGIKQLCHLLEGLTH
ncbi:Spore coat protein SA [Rubripirellula lacrimiformis]|uniref:Spore coat protein SA n=1 Tax=Rubripirellula lacrimiformis TaxID=1930273 RepID=A0A517N8R7_9BACT|nr:glycosyltransferase family 4 protein [Rubripirellula lacrimiformis]QDT03527.1 Spore coat protein SA [Rubripirellula lacrimiformis]